MADRVRGHLADGDDEVGDPRIGQASLPSLLFGPGTNLGQVGGVGEGHGISGCRDHLASGARVRLAEWFRASANP